MYIIELEEHNVRATCSLKFLAAVHNFKFEFTMSCKARQAKRRANLEQERYRIL